MGAPGIYNLEKINERGVLTLSKTNQQECNTGSEIQLNFIEKSNTTNSLEKVEETIVCKKSGRYLMTGKVGFVYNDVIPGKTARIKVNNEIITSSTENTSFTTLNVSAIIQLKENDVISFHVSSSGAKSYPNSFDMFIAEI